MDIQDPGSPQEEAEPGMDPGQVEGPGSDLPPEAYNLVPAIQKIKATDNGGEDGQEWLDKLGRSIIDTTQKDEEGRSKFMERRANQLKLYAGILKPLEYPAEGAKAPHLPILLQAMLSLWSRIWDQVCPAKGDIVHVQTTGQDDEARQVRVEKHMNWQVRTKMPEWASGLASSIMQWLLGGSMFRDYYYDPIGKRNCVDHVPIDQFVIPYSEDDLHPLMPTVSRKTRKKNLAKHVMLQFEELGYYSDVTALYGDEKTGEPPVTTGNSNYTEVSKVKEAANEIGGVKKPDQPDSKDPDAKREVFERQQWMTIPGVDGIKPVKVTVDVPSRKVISLCLREVDDPVDAARFIFETQQYEAISQQLQAGPPPPPPGQEGMPPPPAPVLPEKPAPIRQVPLYTTVHYRLFPNPEGFYGLGAGYLLEQANDIVDGLIADVMVSGKFQNLQGGWIAAGARTKRGDVKAEMGVYKELDVQPDELDKAIHDHQFHPPSQELVTLAELLMNKAESQAANQEILSGEQGGSRETAKSMSIRSGNAMQVVNVMTRLFLEPLKYEFKLMAHGNSVFLDDKEEFYVTEPSKTVPGQKTTTKYSVSRADYLEDYDITFTADARVSSKEQRVGDAMGLVDKVTQTPAIIQSPTGQMLLHLVVQNLFKEMERPDYLAAWGEPPKPPPPPSPMDQFDENAGFLNEKDHPVLPDDNHLEHIAKIEQFQHTPHAKSLTATGKQLMDRHYRAHVAASYQQTVKGVTNGQQQPNPGMGAGPGGPGGIPPRPGNAQAPRPPQGPRGQANGAGPPQGGLGGPPGHSP